MSSSESPSALVEAREAVLRLLTAFRPTRDWIAPADLANQIPLEAFDDGEPRALVLKATLKTERVSRGAYIRRPKVCVVVRAKIGPDCTFRNSDKFHAFVEGLQRALETVRSPVRIVDSELTVPMDPDEFAEAGIATALLSIEVLT